MNKGTVKAEKETITVYKIGSGYVMKYSDYKKYEKISVIPDEAGSIQAPGPEVWYTLE